MPLLLRSVHIRKDPDDPDTFPFNIPVVRAFERLEFDSPVTFLVGENGSGKSTILEAIACAAGSITVGASDTNSDPTLDPIRPLADILRLTWSKKSNRGFFMRAEDFFGFTKRLASIKQEMHEDIRRLDEEYADRSEYAKGLASMAYVNELHALRRYYGDGLDSQSHGESFLLLFRKRFTGPGLYLLDEPEAPLSPMRQLTLLAMLHEMVQQGGQFIIATHSPLIMAYPSARILSFDAGAIEAIDYEELEHVQVTRSFLNDPDSYLRHLFSGE